MAVNKVVYGDNTLIDLTSDTVTAAKMLSGTTAHDKAGTKVTGTIATKTASNMTASGATVTAPAGYYASAESKSVATATQATPSISVDSAGKITASATQTAGYVSAGTKSATKQLITQAAQTITPGTSDQTIAAGKYLTGAQTIKGDANLVPENIASGVSIFGVEGTMEAGGGSGGSSNIDYLAVQVTSAGDVHLWPFEVGMTWEDFYNSQYSGAMFSVDGSRDNIILYFNYDDYDGWAYWFPSYYFAEGEMYATWNRGYFDPVVNMSDTLMGFMSDGHVYTLNNYVS